MGLWSFYFLGKVYLYFKGYIRFEFLLNLLFAFFIIIPVPEKLPARRLLKAAKFVLSFVIAFLILWHGYETHAAIDNDAPSYHFIEDIMKYGRADKPIEIRDLTVRQIDFDDTPIYDDLAILNRWWNIMIVKKDADFFYYGKEEKWKNLPRSALE